MATLYDSFRLSRNFEKFISIISGIAALFLATCANSAEVDAVAILKKSDLARGGGQDMGITWVVDAYSTRTGVEDVSMKLLVKTVETSSVAETLEPLRSKGSKMLQVNRNMWLTKPGLKKPVPISPRQRLTGLAAVGDIAATNYVRDYNGSLLRQEPCGKEQCYVLDLAAVSDQTTYDRIIYWISVERGVGVRAEFLSVSGKKVKTAEFTYDNSIMVKGKPVPFVSQMLIFDDLTDGKTTLTYSSVKVVKIPPVEFDLSQFE